jgi:hypothetical protein
MPTGAAAPAQPSAAANGTVVAPPRVPEARDPQRGLSTTSTAAAAADAAWSAWAPAPAVVADFLFLLHAKHTLVLSVGSFSFWAGWLSDAATVHLPMAGRQALYPLHGENGRFVFHDLG